MRTVIFLDPADEEMVLAAKYYERQTSGLGVDFLIEVERITDMIAEFPYVTTKIRGEIRRRLFRRFPYAILYRVEPEEIVIVAVMHLRRRPGYWSYRV